MPGYQFSDEEVETSRHSGIPFGSGAVIMGTGIVSIALSLEQHETLSRILLALAVLAWIVLGVLLVERALADREQFLAEARSPGSLTLVAGTAVLGVRLVRLGQPAPAAALLGLAVAGWASLTLLVGRRIRWAGTGDLFMLTVAPEGLATLSAAVAGRARAPWLLDAALVLAAVGLVLYPVVLARFEPSQLRWGSGDQWVAGGSLAISSLALALAALARAHLGALTGARVPLKDLAIALWVAAMLWLPPLLAAELRWPRLRYHRARWSTVFPLGMYAVCSFAVAAAAHTPAVRGFAHAWVWVALAGWLAVAAGMLRRAASGVLRGRPAPRSGRS